MELFKTLSNDEQQFLLKAPAYISLLAANLDGEMDEKEKKEAIELTHIKTFSTEPILRDYFKTVEVNFRKDILQLDNSLSKDPSEREKEIKMELSRLELIFQKLEEPFRSALHKSLQDYTDHVSKAHRNSLEFFLIPFFIKGLTD